MEHTKSKLKVYKGFDRLYLYAIQLLGSPRIADIPDTGAITKEERIANAAHIGRCWNEHDNLKAKADCCEELVATLRTIKTAAGKSPGDVFYYLKADNALAKYKEIEK